VVLAKLIHLPLKAYIKLLILVKPMSLKFKEWLWSLTRWEIL